MKYYIIDLFRKEVISEGYTITEAKSKLFIQPKNIYIANAMSATKALAKV